MHRSVLAVCAYFNVPAWRPGRYGSTQDGAILGGSMKTIKALFPHVEVGWAWLSRAMPKQNE